jgi:hypothetical protein
MDGWALQWILPLFVVPVDPGAMAIYPQWAALTTIKMIDVTFLCGKNHFLSYKNIAELASACLMQTSPLNSRYQMPLC